MKLIIQVLMMTCIIALTNGCTKEETLLKTSGEFIEASINNDLIRYESTSASPYNNYYFYDTIITSVDTIIQDQLNLIRYADDGDKSFDIFITGRRLDKNEVPITLNNVSLQWRNHAADIQNIFGPGDGANYSGGADLVIEDWDENDFLSGSFSGNISTVTGKSLSVKNGKFRIQIFD
ncbi:MAG: hypothetical protein AAF573_12145 [Bacteroidota bacterium]